MTTERPELPPPSLRIVGARTALVATLVGGLAVAAVAGIVQGRAELVGTLVGTALVCGFFLFGALSTTMAAAYAPNASLVVAMLTYVLQVLGLGVVLLALTGSGLTEDAVDSRWLAGAVIVGTLVWTGALVWRTLAGTEARR